MTDKLILTTSILQSLTSGGLNTTHTHPYLVQQTQPQWQTVSINVTLGVNKRYIVDTTDAISLPSSCAVGDEIHIIYNYSNVTSGKILISGVTVQDGASTATFEIRCSGYFSIGFVCTTTNVFTVMYKTNAGSIIYDYTPVF